MITLSLFPIFASVAMASLVSKLRPDFDPNGDTLVLDLDNTLYPPSNGLLDHLTEVIWGYTAVKLQVDINAAKEIGNKYYFNYGSTPYGLIRDGVPCGDFDAYLVENVDYTLVTPDESLKLLLTRVKAPIIVFTNSPLQYASRTLEILGIFHLIHAIVYPNFNDPFFGRVAVKPSQEAYDHFHIHFSKLNREHIHFVDDSSQNIIAAKAFGWRALRYEGSDVESLERLDGIIYKLHELEHCFPHLFH